MPLVVGAWGGGGGGGIGHLGSLSKPTILRGGAGRSIKISFSGVLLRIGVRTLLN